MKLLACFLALVVAALVVAGFFTQASISSEARFVNQGVNFAIALVVAVPLAFVPPSYLTRKWVLAVLVLAIVAGLAVVHIPGLTKGAINGAGRWIYIAIAGRKISFQPSEVVKVAYLLLLAWWMQGHARKRESYEYRVFWPIAALGLVSIGFLAQKDYGSVIMLALVSMPVMLIGGAKFYHLLPWGMLAAVLLAVLIAIDPARSGRIQSFVNRDKVADNKSYQVDQSRRALADGGVTGVGYGDSMFKHRYLPENHTDFVFAMIGEEWGFAGTTTCLALYLAFFCMGLVITARAPDLFSAFTAFGLTLHITLAAGVNTGMVAGMLPTKGLALPFISYGGSNLLCSLIAAGILISICWNCKPRRRKQYEEEGIFIPA